MNKKGFIGDMLAYTIMLFGIAIVILSVWIFLKSFNTAWQASDNIPAESKSIIAYQTSKFVPVWDGFMTLAIIGYFIALVIAGMMIRTHPVFAMFAFIILIGIGIVSIYLANAYYTIENTPTISPYSVSFPRMNFIIEKLPYFVVGLGILFIIILYAKNSGDVISV